MRVQLAVPLITTTNDGDGPLHSTLGRNQLEMTTLTTGWEPAPQYRHNWWVRSATITGLSDGTTYGFRIQTYADD